MSTLNRLCILVSAAWLSVLMARPSCAGDDANVDAGVAAFEQQDFDLAIRELEAALEDPGALRPDNVPRARYHLGKALLAAYKANGNPETGPLGEAPVRAATALLEVRASASEEWADRAAAEVDGAAMILANGASAVFSAPEGEGRSEAIARSDRWMSKAIELRPQTYMLYDARGQIREMGGRKDEAYEDFRQALAQYKAQPPDPPDLYIGYAAYRAATVSRFDRGDPTQALSELEEGLALLETEWARTGTASPELQHTYAQMTRDLDHARLDILLNTPELLQTALDEFETSVREQPDDFKLIVAYASLLEHTDPAAAIVMYERAISVDGTQSVAQHNLGAIYFNRSTALFNQADQMMDYEAAEAVQEEALAELRKARPHFEKALSLSPDDESTLQALKSIMLNLGDTEAYESYKERLQQLQ